MAHKMHLDESAFHPVVGRHNEYWRLLRPWRKWRVWRSSSPVRSVG